MYPGISVKTSLQKYKDYTLLRLKFLVVRLVQSLAVTKDFMQCSVLFILHRKKIHCISPGSFGLRERPSSLRTGTFETWRAQGQRMRLERWQTAVCR